MASSPPQYLLLSSGSSERYRHDVLRAIALPTGAHLQFRYATTLLDPAVQSALRSGKPVHGEALIAYVDRQSGTFVPCRMAEILDATLHGSTATVLLQLGDLAHAPDLAAFAVGILPAKDAKVGRRLYWTALNAALANVTRKPLTLSNLGTWEAVVAQLATHADFANERYFYTIPAVTTRRGKLLVPEKGRYVFRPGALYEIRVYHLHPLLDTAPDAPAGYLAITTDSPELAITTTNRLSIDSPYDMKTIRFKTGRPNRAVDNVLTFARIPSGSKDTLGEFDFDLPYRVRSDAVSRMLLMIALTLSLSAAVVPVYLINPQVNNHDLPFLIMFTVAANLAAAYFAAFHITRPVAR